MKNFLTSLAFLLLFGCNIVNHEAEKDGTRSDFKTLCSTKDPVEDLPWLKEMVTRDSPCPVHTVSTGVYKGEVIFMPNGLSELCCGCGGYAVYNCKGDLLFSCDMGEFEKVTDVKVIWKAE